MLREQSGAPYDNFYLVRKVLLFEWLFHCPAWHESGVSCDHGRTRTRIVVEDEDAVDDAYHPDTCPHEAQVMLLILLITSYN